jgi:hypothetical protein
VHYRRIAASVLLTLILAWSAPLARAQAASPSPTSFHLLEASIDDIHQAFKSKRIRCHALVELYFKRIQAYDKVGPSLNAIQSINAGALSEADRLDAAFRSSGLVGALHCIPVLVKDQVETNDMPTTYESVAIQGLHSAEKCDDHNEFEKCRSCDSRKDDHGRIRFRISGLIVRDFP